MPINEVRAAFNALENAPSTQRAVQAHPALRDFLAYFENNYINGPFPIALWNVYHRNMDTRTNNRVESK